MILKLFLFARAFSASTWRRIATASPRLPRAKWTRIASKVIGYYLPGAHQFSNIYDVSRTLCSKCRNQRPSRAPHGGYPVPTPLSCEARDGADDERDLWSATRETLCALIDAGEPIRWVVVENVRGLLKLRSWANVRWNSPGPTNLGYRVGWCCFGIDEAGGSAAPARQNLYRWILGSRPHGMSGDRNGKEGQGMFAQQASQWSTPQAGKTTSRSRKWSISERERGGASTPLLPDAGRGLGRPTRSADSEGGTIIPRPAPTRPRCRTIDCGDQWSQLADSEHCAGKPGTMGSIEAMGNRGPGRKPSA